MISTRLHGVIDYSVSAALGLLSASGRLSRPIRNSLRGAGAYHASYSVVTDYEAGLSPRLSMRQHLALDSAGAIALIGAGLLMRRPPPRERALLVGIGLAELAVVAFSSTTPSPGITPNADRGLGTLANAGGFEGVDYQPLDTPKPVADDIFIVDSLLPGVLGKLLAVRMTEIRLQNGDLLLYSPTRFTARLQAELQQLGRIRHLVAPSFAHWMFLAEWQRQCPDATTWAAPGLKGRRQVRAARVRIDHELGESAPVEWARDVALCSIPGGFGFREVALFHRASRTALLADLVQNFERRKVPVLMRPIVRLLGVMAPGGSAPLDLRAVIALRRSDAAQAVRALLAMQPERVIFAHGRWFDRDGTAALRQATRWLLG